MNDCALMSYGGAAAITGEDKAATYRGRYTDRAGSALALRELGKGTLLRTVNADYAKKPPSMAQRGDLVWFARSLGICMGAAALFVGEEHIADAAGLHMRDGLVSIPRALWQKAWSVG